MSNKIDYFYAGNVGNMRSHFASAVKQLEKDFGIKFDLGRITYSTNEFRCKLTCSVVKTTATGKPIAPEVTAFNQIASTYGLTASDLFKPFTYQGRQFELVGARSGNTKFRFKVRGVMGGMYKMTPYMVLKAMGKANAEYWAPQPTFRSRRRYRF